MRPWSRLPHFNIFFFVKFQCSSLPQLLHKTILSKTSGGNICYLSQIQMYFLFSRVYKSAGFFLIFKLQVTYPYFYQILKKYIKYLYLHIWIWIGYIISQVFPDWSWFSVGKHWTNGTWWYGRYDGARVCVPIHSYRCGNGSETYDQQIIHFCILQRKKQRG